MDSLIGFYKPDYILKKFPKYSTREFKKKIKSNNFFKILFLNKRDKNTIFLFNFYKKNSSYLPFIYFTFTFISLWKWKYNLYIKIFLISTSSIVLSKYTKKFIKNTESRFYYNLFLRNREKFIIYQQKGVYKYKI